MKEPNTTSPEVFRLKRYYVILGLFMSVFMGGSFLCMSFLKAGAIGELLMGLSVSLFFVLLGLYMSLSALLGRIIISEDEVIDKGIFQTKRFRFCDVTSLDWSRSRPGWSFVILFHGGKLRIEGQQFSNKDFNRMVYLFRTRVVEDCQENWSAICHYYSTSNDYRDVELNPPDPSKGEILITRARYDRLGIVLFLLSLPLAVFALFQDMPEMKALAGFPLLIIFFWLLMRFQTSPKGEIHENSVSRQGSLRTFRSFLWTIVGLVFIFLTETFPDHQTILWLVGFAFILFGFGLFMYRGHQDDQRRKRQKQEEIERFAMEGNLYPEPVFGRVDETGKCEVELRD